MDEKGINSSGRGSTTAEAPAWTAQFSGFLVSLLLLTASLATPLKRTVAQIEADIASITTQVTVLHSAVQDFPASGVVGALSIHSDATVLETTVNQAAADLKATGPLSKADASIIINSIMAFEPTMLDALQQLIAKHGNFGNIMRGYLSASETALAQALFAVVPVDLQAKLTGLTNVSTALAAAISAYSS
ncbi:hydrophobic surface binding protein [Mycena leptocephala]|nr:hydrophobic surface binding protein [Mycena leptocephala]